MEFISADLTDSEDRWFKSSTQASFFKVRVSASQRRKILLPLKLCQVNFAFINVQHKTSCDHKV